MIVVKLVKVQCKEQPQQRKYRQQTDNAKNIGYLKISTMNPTLQIFEPTSVTYDQFLSSRKILIKQVFISDTSCLYTSNFVAISSIFVHNLSNGILLLSRSILSFSNQLGFHCNKPLCWHSTF